MFSVLRYYFNNFTKGKGWWWQIKTGGLKQKNIFKKLQLEFLHISISVFPCRKNKETIHIFRFYYLKKKNTKSRSKNFTKNDDGGRMMWIKRVGQKQRLIRLGKNGGIAEHRRQKGTRNSFGTRTTTFLCFFLFDSFVCCWIVVLFSEEEEGEGVGLPSWPPPATITNNRGNNKSLSSSQADYICNILLTGYPGCENGRICGPCGA